MHTVVTRHIICKNNSSLRRTTQLCQQQFPVVVACVWHNCTRWWYMQSSIGTFTSTSNSRRIHSTGTSSFASTYSAIGSTRSPVPYCILNQHQHQPQYLQIAITTKKLQRNLSSAKILSLSKIKVSFVAAALSIVSSSLWYTTTSTRVHRVSTLVAAASFHLSSQTSFLLRGFGEVTTTTTTTTTRRKRNSMAGNSITERLSDGTIIVSPKNEAIQSALVVISHGLGDTAEGFVDVAEQFMERMPYCKFVLPTAPTQKVTMNMGMSMPSWYDITGLDERSNENCAAIESSMERIRTILDTEHNGTKLPYNRMVLAGFSQGGALSLFTGFQLKKKHDVEEDNQEAEQQPKLAGIVCMSGYLPALSKFQVTDGLHNTPVLHCHGTQDMLVQFTMAQKTVSKMRDELGVTDYTFKEYAIGHTVSTQELSDVLEFLQNKLPDDPKYRIQLLDPQEMSIKQLREVIRKAGLTQKAIGFLEKKEYVQLVQAYRSGKL